MRNPWRQAIDEVRALSDEEALHRALINGRIRGAINTVEQARSVLIKMYGHDNINYQKKLVNGEVEQIHYKIDQPMLFSPEELKEPDLTFEEKIQRWDSNTRKTIR